MNPVASANLLAWAVQAAVIVAVAAPIPRLLGVWSPRARVAIWRTVLVACLFLPLLQPRVVTLAPAPAPAMEEAMAAAVSGGVPAVGGTGPAAHAGTPAPARWWWSPRVLAGVVAAGVLVRLGWLGLGLLTLARLRRTARPLD